VVGYRNLVLSCQSLPVLASEFQRPIITVEIGRNAETAHKRGSRIEERIEPAERSQRE